MAADVSYQNVVHKRMGGKQLVIPTGCSQDIESGGVLKIGGTEYINSAGKVVQQYENLSSANDGETLTNYGMTYISPVIVASTFVLGPGVANVQKTVLIGNGTTSTSVNAAVTIKSTGCLIIEASSSTAGATLTGTAYQAGSVNLIAESTAVWRVLGKMSTSIALS
jgi:hypothetical protein